MNAAIDKEAVKRNVDMLGLASRYVKLAKVGNVYQGLCPFHSEDTPSFTVYPETQSFHCFGCDVGGDQLKFFGLIENVDSFPEILARLSKGIVCTPQLDHRVPRKPEVKPKPVPGKDVLEMYKQAYEMSRTALLKDTGAEAEGVRRYLAGRGFSIEDLEKLRIGAYLPKHREYFRNNYGKEIVEKSGLVSYGKGYNYRIIFPHYNSEGIIVGFAFRLTIEGPDHDGKPFRKYKFTPLYNKDYPFNIYFAAPSIKKTGEVVIVEGHLDALALISMGLENVVCLGGHSLNREHIAHCVKYGAKSFLLWMDNDDPGMKGAMKAVRLVLLENKVMILVVSCSYNDVGEINKETDREKRKKIIDASLKAASFGPVWLGKIMMLGIGDREKLRILEEGKEIYSQIIDSIQKRQFLKSLARGAGLKLVELERIFSGKSQERKPVQRGDMKRVLLLRLNAMIKQEVDYPQMLRFLEDYYRASRKKMTPELKELVVRLIKLIRNYEIEAFTNYIACNLPEVAVVGRK